MDSGVNNYNNNEVNSSSHDEKINPPYCSFYKFLLVEELVLQDDLLNLHYGKCKLIGKLSETADGLIKLENIGITNFPSEYSIPEGTVAIRLLTKGLPLQRPRLQQGRFYEVSGEVILLNKEVTTANHCPLTSRDLNLKVNILPDDSERSAYIEKIKATHEPAISADFISEIDRAGDLIERNLLIRKIQFQDFGLVRPRT